MNRKAALTALRAFVEAVATITRKAVAWTR